MTKIAYASDLHLEFHDLNLQNKDNIDILLLLGDICTPHRWKMNHNSSARKTKELQMGFFARISNEFPLVLMTLGNHEHYHGDYLKTEEILKNELSKYSNIQVGNHLLYEEEDFAISMTTLWTDFDKNSPLSMMKANGGMNDFQIVRYGDLRKFQAQDAYEIHKQSIIDIEMDFAKANGKTLILGTHHLPSLQAISVGFRDSDLNGAYASDLDWLLEKYNVKYALHGHSHPPLDMMIGNTRLLRAPRGYYGYENTPEQDSKYTYGIIEV